MIVAASDVTITFSMRLMMISESPLGPNAVRVQAERPVAATQFFMIAFIATLLGRIGGDYRDGSELAQFVNTICRVMRQTKTGSWRSG